MSEPNVLLEVFCSIILGMILLSCIFEKNKSKQNIAYIAMLIGNICALGTEALSIAFRGVAGMDGLLSVLNFASYLCGYLLAYFYVTYVYACISIKRKLSSAVLCTAAILGAAGLGFLAVGCYWGLFFRVVDGVFYMMPLFPLSFAYDVIGMGIAMFLLIRHRKSLSIGGCLALFSFPALVIAALVLQYTMLRKTSQLYVLTMLSLVMIYLMIQKDRIRKTAHQQKEMEEMRMQLMLSQIRPHFIFNSLSCIRRLISKDQEAAIKAVEEFSLYLRKNLDSLNSTQPVPFSRELEHTKEYLYLEHLRFGDRLRVVYEIGCSDFSLPALTVQPIVENAAKHGVLERVEGGTIWISTQETATAFLVCVRDDGVGFDPQAMPEDGSTHIGIPNVRYRLKAQCGGELFIRSERGAGTTVTVQLPKKATGGARQ